MAVPPALLLGALGLFAPAPAEAQTLPPGALGDIHIPTNLVVTAGDQKLDLSWTTGFSATIVDGGGHWVQYKRQVDSDWTTSTSTLGQSDTSHSITSLTNGTAYDVRIFAVANASGVLYRGQSVTGSGTPSATSTPNTNANLPPSTGVELESAAFLPGSGGHDLVIPEGGSATFGVRLTAVPAANTTVNLMKLVAQQFHGNFNAVTVSPTTLTFTPGNYSTFQTVTVTGVADDDNDHEHVIVAAQIAGGKYWANGVYVTVSDDGGAVQVGVQPAIVREIDNQLIAEYEITFWLSRAASSQVTVDVNLGVGGTATEGADFDWTVSTVTFAPGETRKTVRFPVYDDDVEDSGETFFVELSNPTGATIAPGYNRARVEIRNDEAHLDGLTVEGAVSIDGPFTALDIGAFAAETTDYAVTVPYGTTHARVTPTTADEDLTLSAGSGTELTRVRSGESGPAVALEVGENVLVVKVVAGTDVEETYRVTVTRQQPAGTTTDTPTTTTSSSDSASVSLLATPNPVGEGSPVTVRATVSLALWPSGPLALWPSGL